MEYSGGTIPDTCFGHLDSSRPEAGYFEFSSYINWYISIFYQASLRLDYPVHSALPIKVVPIFPDLFKTHLLLEDLLELYRGYLLFGVFYCSEKNFLYFLKICTTHTDHQHHQNGPTQPTKHLVWCLPGEQGKLDQGWIPVPNSANETLFLRNLSSEPRHSKPIHCLVREHINMNCEDWETEGTGQGRREEGDRADLQRRESGREFPEFLQCSGLCL